MAYTDDEKQFYINNYKPADTKKEDVIVGDDEKDIDSYFFDADTAIVFEEGFDEMKKYIDACPECASYCDGFKTLLHTAARKGTPQMIEYIAKSGGDVNYDVKRMTPLCKAISKHKIDNVKKLIELGAGVNSEDEATNPVMRAVWDYETEIIKILIDAGADLTIQYGSREDEWWNALTYAMYNHRDEEAEVIREALRKQNIDFTADEEQFYRNNGKPEDTGIEDVYYEEYIAEHLGAVVKYYDEGDILEMFWGGVKQVNDDTEVGIYALLPEGKEYGVLITSGMSEYPMARTDDGLEFAEVMMKVPREWLEQENLLDDGDHSWVIEMLSKTAYLGHMFEGSYVNEKVIVPYGTPDEAYPFDWDYEFTSVMLCPSADIPTLKTDEETKVKFYTLVPITEEEKALVEEQGSLAVRDQLSSKDVVDMDRELLVEPEDAE